jgi:hypothetical protein
MFPHNKVSRTADMIAITIGFLIWVIFAGIISFTNVLATSWISVLLIILGFIVFQVIFSFIVHAIADAVWKRQIRAWITGYTSTLPALENKTLAKLNLFTENNNRIFKKFGFLSGIDQIHGVYFSLVDRKNPFSLKYKDLSIKAEVRDGNMVTSVMEGKKKVAEYGGIDEIVKPGEWLFTLDTLFKEFERGNYPFESKVYEKAKKDLIKKIR